MLSKLICLSCHRQLTKKQGRFFCCHCGREYPYRDGIVSFLSDEDSFNPTNFQDKQERAWGDSAQIRSRIRQSRLLTRLNSLRVQFSLSGRRDRIFYREMRHGGRERLILDIGCGGGRHYFCNYGRVIGIDPVLELLKIARTMYDEVYHASAFELPFANNAFDYVVSSDVIGHVPPDRKDQMFAEMHRVLRPGGRTVHVIETDATNIWFRFAHQYPALFQKYFVDVPGHISMELPTELRARFLRHGFKEIRFKKFAGIIQECGTISGLFNNEYKFQNAVVRLVVGMDRLLSSSLIVREFTNLVLELPAQILDAITPLNSTNGALVVFEK